MRYFQSFLSAVIVFAALFFSSFLTPGNAEEIAIYVSPEGNDSWTGSSVDKPFATLNKARNAIRTMKKESRFNKPVTVYLRGGMYELSEPFILTLEDSGTESCPITYRAYPGEKPIISGGRKITGQWKKYKGKIMVCTLNKVKEDKWKFRQLFLDNKRQIRARIPNKDYYRIASTETQGKSDMQYREGDFEIWHNLNDVEVVIFHSWNESRLFISELNEQERRVTFTGPVGGRGIGSRAGILNRYYIDNVLEGLDQPGEWYLDNHSGDLYYWHVGHLENYELRAPVLTYLVRFEGNVEEKKYVQHIKICGLTFSDADWTLPKEGIPTIRDVGDIWKPSAITLEGACHCTLEDNCIRNVGTYAIEVTGYDNKIIGNEIYDTGSGGIISRNYSTERNIISYNHIHHCGEVFHSAVGINIDDGGGLVSHNLIHDISQSGIYTRHWATETQEIERRNQEQGLIIEYNEIYNVMQKINDGGGLFVRDSDIIIRNNLIHDVYSYTYYKDGFSGYDWGCPGWGIYLGCETRNTIVENNVVYRAREGVHVWYSDRNITIENNIFVDGEISQIYYQNPKDRNHENIKAFRNIFYNTRADAIVFNISGERSAPVESDFNLFYNTRGAVTLNPFTRGLQGGDYFDDWQNRSYDMHSIVADPLFTDPENDDYSLQPDSPAFKLGFKPIDLSTVGLRGRKSK